MKQNRLKQFLCLLFFLLCLALLAIFLLAGPSSAGANERLAAKPRLYTGTSVNWDVLSDAADYFSGRFGLRQELITADAAVRAAVFHESAADDVLLGTDGWLYYADTLGDFTGSSAMTERQLWCAARNLALMQEYAASRGAQLLFVCAPNKNTVYPEFMPARYVRSKSERNLDRLLASLREQGVPFCDVRDVLRNANSLTYYRTGSHWNGYGSALASEAFTMQPHRGDLFEMLYPASSRTEDGPALAHARSFSYADDFHAADDQRCDTQRQLRRILCAAYLCADGHETAEVNGAVAEHRNVNIKRWILLVDHAVRRDHRHVVKETSHQTGIGRPAVQPSFRHQQNDGHGKAGDRGEFDREHYHALYKWADETIALHHVFTSNQRLDRR